MKYNFLTILIFLSLSLASTHIVADTFSVITLVNNPFEQPEMGSDQLRNNADKKNRGEMKLRGTMLDGEDSLVNIGGQFYRLNEQVSGYDVVEITGTSVTLRRGSSERVLTLNDDD